MTELIADMLAQHYQTLDYISAAYGCVQEYHTKGKRYPISRKKYQDDQECLPEGDYFTVLPESAQTGIVFFEDRGAQVDKAQSNSRYNVWKGTMNVTCWVNLKKIGTANDLGVLQRSFLESTPSALNSQSNFFGGIVKQVRILPKRPSTFERYSFDEDKRKFLTHPYDYFTIQLEYTARLSLLCPVNVVINPEVCA